MRGSPSKRNEEPRAENVTTLNVERATDFPSPRSSSWITATLKGKMTISDSQEAEMLGRLFGRRRSSGKRVIVIGLDGVPYSFIRRHAQSGELPNMARMLKSGSFFRIKSVTVSYTHLTLPTTPYV